MEMERDIGMGIAESERGIPLRVIGLIDWDLPELSKRMVCQYLYQVGRSLLTPTVGSLRKNDDRA